MATFRRFTALQTLGENEKPMGGVAGQGRLRSKGRGISEDYRMNEKAE